MVIQATHFDEAAWDAASAATTTFDPHANVQYGRPAAEQAAAAASRPARPTMATARPRAPTDDQGFDPRQGEGPLEGEGAGSMAGGAVASSAEAIARARQEREAAWSRLKAQAGQGGAAP